MNFPQNIEAKLGFDQIREKLSHLCTSTMGQERIAGLRYHSNPENLQSSLAELAEMLYMQQYDRAGAYEQVPDGREHIQRLEIEGFFLQEEALHNLRPALRNFETIRLFLARRNETYPVLSGIIRPLPPMDKVLAQLDAVLDEKGEMRPNASPALMRLKREADALSHELDRKLRSIFKKARESGWAAETEITIRDGRLVIPMLAEHRRKISGFVHDESANGNIHYMEPAEVLEMNNRSREIAIERRRETERILREISAFLAPQRQALQSLYGFLGHFDGLRAKALLAIKMSARIPKWKNEPGIRLFEAVHPLLFEKNQAEGRNTIPLNLMLDDEKRILLISGPNAGGKSVAMKTTGLLQYMFQCGLAVPVNEASVFGFFKKIFLDIGDEQSLEQDLSTYSSHLRNMTHFLRHGRGDTLILIDEFGTGTDPQFGGPIAESILEQLNRKGCYGVITTHYSNLKLLAERMPGLVNGSMAFDTEALRPLFRMETGKPGSSFAFEVAQKTGLPQPVIDRARKLAGKKHGNVDELIIQLEREKNLLEEERTQLSTDSAHYARLVAEYTALKKVIEENRKKILAGAKTEALHIVTKAQKEAEKLIADMGRKISVGPLPAEEVRKKLAKEKAQLEQELNAEEDAENEVIPDLKPGDLVRLKNQEIISEVVEIQRKKAIIAYGDIKTTVSINKLEKVEALSRNVRRALRGIDLNAKLAGFSTRLDLRGQRGEEALQNLEQWLDSAILTGLGSLSIVHGKGNGTLRQLVRNRLRQYPQVKKLYDEHADRGGDGVTLVELN